MGKVLLVIFLFGLLFTVALAGITFLAWLANRGLEDGK